MIIMRKHYNKGESVNSNIIPSNTMTLNTHYSDPNLVFNLVQCGKHEVAFNGFVATGIGCS